MATKQETVTRNAITLKGSAQMVAEFFYYGINSILYQRGVYPPDSFKRIQKYGTSMLVVNDKSVNDFLKPCISQLEVWLSSKVARTVVVVIMEVNTKEVLGRWQFDVCHEDGDGAASDGTATSSKPEKKIRQEIADVIRQITASIAFLPLLENRCTFDILMYVDDNVKQAPDGWGESQSFAISNAREVHLRPMSTGLHTVETKVAYKGDDD